MAASASVLPPPPAQRSTHLLAGLHAGQERGELRALVLDLEPALDEFGLGLHGRAAPVLAGRDAQAERRERRLAGAEMRAARRAPRSRDRTLRVLTRRSRGARRGQRLHLRHEVVAEGARAATARSSPGKSPATCGRRVVEVARLEPRRAPRRSSGAGAKRSPENRAPRSPSTCQPALKLSMPRTTARGRRLAHDPGRRGFAAQRVVDEAGDRGAVLRAGEAVRQAPVLQGLGGGPAAGLDIGENLDGGGEAGGGCHAGITIFLERSERNRAAPPPIDRLGTDAKFRREDPQRKDDPHQDEDDRADEKDRKAVLDSVRGRVDCRRGRSASPRTSRTSPRRECRPCG